MKKDSLHFNSGEELRMRKKLCSSDFPGSVRDNLTLLPSYLYMVSIFSWAIFASYSLQDFSLQSHKEMDDLKSKLYNLLEDKKDGLLSFFKTM